MNSWLAWGSEPARLLGSIAAVLLYALMCTALWRRSSKERSAAQARAAALTPTAGAGPAWIVAYASQTGTAERLAWQTAEALHASGRPARVAALGTITREELATAERALFIVATYGEGDAPDNAATFAAQLHADDTSGLPSARLPSLHYAVLALGSSHYKHFCGFGRALDKWLQDRGATPMFERIEADSGGGSRTDVRDGGAGTGASADTEVGAPSSSDLDRAASASAIARWQRELARVGIDASGTDWSGSAFEPCALISRRQLNPGTTGEPTFEVLLKPPAGEPIWQAGDLAQVRVPSDLDRPRDYSIASLPSEGLLKLLVRQQRHHDGTLGSASGWLTDQAPLGASVDLRLRANTSFQAGDNTARPLILVGNGTGMSGLRAHMKARADAATGTRLWLLFGERRREHDFYWQGEIEQWQREGVLERVDLAFSRDQADKIYVQDLLATRQHVLQEWLDAGAAIYVCGSLEGMAGGVHRCLVAMIGQDAVDALSASGRYRRDVY